MYNVLIFYALFNEEAPFYKQFGSGGTILLVILERRPHFIGYLRDEASVSWVNLGGSCWIFYLCPKLCWRWAGVLFLWSMLYLESR